MHKQTTSNNYTALPALAGTLPKSEMNTLDDYEVFGFPIWGGKG
jgi:hypothetical protein